MNIFIHSFSMALSSGMWTFLIFLLMGGIFGFITIAVFLIIGIGIYKIIKRIIKRFR